MQICVCGWYFRDDYFYDLMRKVNVKYPVTVISNNPDSKSTDGHGLIFMPRENIGLEWGAYDSYLQNEAWDGESDVLFLHDDIRFHPVVKNYEMLDPMVIFDTIEKLDFDQVYLFGSLKMAKDNYYIHGRALKCSAKFLKQLKADGGFWYDKNNDGHTRGPTPDYCEHYNKADYKFAEYIKGLKVYDGKMKAGEYVILPPLDAAVRGKFKSETEGPVEDK